MKVRITVSCLSLGFFQDDMGRTPDLVFDRRDVSDTPEISRRRLQRRNIEVPIFLAFDSDCLRSVARFSSLYLFPNQRAGSTSRVVLPSPLLICECGGEIKETHEEPETI